MSIILDGTSGITSPGGDTATVSVATPIIKSPSSLTLQTNGSTTAVTVDTSQNVGIGTTSPSSFGQLAVVTSGNPIIYTGSTTSGNAGAVAIQGNGSGSYPSLNFSQTSTNYWTIGQRGDTNLYLYRQSGSGIVIIPNNPLQVATTIGVGTTPATSGAGISFPATQSASSDANTLDDYEEGTWTPQITDGTNTISSAQTCTYTKVGQLVQANMVIYNANISGFNTGVLTLKNLPFSVSGVGSADPIFFGATTNNLPILCDMGGTSGTLYQGSSGANASGMNKNNFNNTSAISLWGTIVYRCNA